MEKNVLMMDDPFWCKPWKEGIEGRFGCNVSLTDSLETASERLRKVLS